MCSETVMDYSSYEVLIDIEDVGEAIDRVPIMGECCVPKLSVQESIIPFGECYLRYPYRQVLPERLTPLRSLIECLPQ